MFNSAKYILFESFNAPMMENTAQFKNKVTGVSLLKVWSFLTKASSNQFATFQVNCIVEKQNVTKAVDLIPATSVFSTDIHRLLLFHWKPPEYLNWFGQEFHQPVFETDILLQSMKWSRFSSTGCLDDLRYIIMTGQYLLGIGNACDFILIQLWSSFLKIKRMNLSHISQIEFIIWFVLCILGKISKTE